MYRTLLVAAASVVASGVALADAPFAPAGTFSVTYTFTTSTPQAPIEIGGGRDLTVNNNLATMVNDEGRGFLHLLAGHCMNIRLTDRTSRTLDTKAYCNFKDADGDVLYARYVTGASKRSDAITHAWTLDSGTGKYLGVRGRAEDTNSNNFGETGVYQAAGKLVGRYESVRDEQPAPDATKAN